MKQHYDIIIAGGGMVGLTLALCLQSVARQNNQASQWRILVAEGFPVRDKSQSLVHQPSFDARSTALAYGSKKLFEQLGIWESLQKQVAAIDTIHVSEQGKLFHCLMEASRENLPALGYVVENSWLGQVLLNAAIEAGQIEFLSPVKVVDAKCGEQQTEVVIDKSGEQQALSCSLLVVADGAQSGLREKLGISSSYKPYFQQALIGNVAFSKPHNGRAFERFTAQGPMALLPLNDIDGLHRAALVWTREPQSAEHLLQCPAEEFLEALQRDFGYRLGRFSQVGERVCYPISAVQVDEQVRRGVVVMGNAAHFLHPVAGQGFNLSVRDCAALAEILGSRPEALGELDTLQEYYQRRKNDQIVTSTFSDQLINVFSGKALPGPLREFGLLGLELLPGIKSGLVSQAAGLFGEESRVAGAG